MKGQKKKKRIGKMRIYDGKIIKVEFKSLLINQSSLDDFLIILFPKLHYNTK